MLINGVIKHNNNSIEKMHLKCNTFLPHVQKFHAL